ncbi:hypothetical protein FVEN_g4515 [Fusarium venenatum]|uniref:Uncharacterized protein n=1 Tax=Fusarium venenatum TaxID=56646 RepID=A0A2L2T5J1_9HYPO|nr:uncharacterized protein FVRRES_02586 [Fusarium venenatum]KAG8357776.1 hypothetical protein FVEN_g4515 [Fusarium venenatum]KAH7004319.1 hypothetical protein EDB82DRAFT_471082 [Fusarium venenatum]CEI66074.1 unnamed protein product [Fusarium venenatum]
MARYRYGKEKAASVLKDDNESTITQRAKKVLEKIYWMAPTYELTQHETAVIVANPKQFQLDRRSRLFLRPDELVYLIDKHIIRSNEFLKTPMRPPDRSGIPIAPAPQQYEAPAPKNGDGHMAGWLRDGKKIKSGYVFEVNHDTVQEVRLFHDMIRLQWECLCLLMLRGVSS